MSKTTTIMTLPTAVPTITPILGQVAELGWILSSRRKELGVVNNFFSHFIWLIHLPILINNTPLSMILEEIHTANSYHAVIKRFKPQYGSQGT